MLIADENINFKIIKCIRDIGIDVISIHEQLSGISDEEVVKLAVSSSRIILTEDKDFGEWVFAHNQKNISVILLRYQHRDLLKIIFSLSLLLKDNPASLFGNFITITPNKIRIRQINDSI